MSALKHHWPSHQPEYRRAYRLKNRSRDAERARRWHHKNREKILARQRARYRSDPVYREKMKEHSRNFYKHPDKIAIGRAYRQKKYWADPQRFILKTREWYIQNHERALKQQRLRRIANRDENRARARMESLLLTDSYVRNQLSKYSNKGTKEWTETEVSARRLETLSRRARRIDDAKAKEIRALAMTSDRFNIAAKFNVSPSLVWLILSNKIHPDPDWKPERKIRSWQKVTAFFKAFDQGARLARAIQNAA